MNKLLEAAPPDQEEREKALETLFDADNQSAGHCLFA